MVFRKPPLVFAADSFAGQSRAKRVSDCMSLHL